LINQSFFIVCIAIIVGLKKQEQPAHNPMFFNMDQEYKEIALDQEIFNFTGQDTTVVHQLRMLSDSLGAPRFFYADIETPVCADGECKLAKIKVYWNLLGNYVGFGVFEKTPLTKNEHDPFTHADYKKLHQLLGDRYSVLERRKMDDLIDEVPIVGAALKTYKGIDAISGATKKEIKESVVKGGLYSCYTLWHLANGAIVKAMKSHLETIYSDAITNYLLQSSYLDYQEYGLKKLSKEKFEEHIEDVIRIFHTTSPITRAYILKKIPRELFQKEIVTMNFYSKFHEVDKNTRTQLIAKMIQSDPKSSELLVIHIDIMTNNQLESYLELLKKHSAYLNEFIKKELKTYARSKDVKYNLKVTEFIREV
jgi:hypothetical protein